MGLKKQGFAKKLVSTWILALYMAQLSQPVSAVRPTAWAEAGRDISAPLKTDVGQEETDTLIGGTKKSNVLFLIESTAAMSFTPKGVLPQVQMVSGWDLSFVEGAEWNKTRGRFQYGPKDIDRMMKEATFGMGALPAAWSGRDLRPERNLYGRDVDASNNFKKGATLEETMKLNANNYYFPFTGEDNPISDGLYKGQVTGLEVGFEGCPEVWPYSTVDRSTAFDSNDRAGYPTDYDRGHWNGTADAWYYDTKYSAVDLGYYKSTKPRNNDGGARTAQNFTRHVRDTAAGYGDQIIAPYSYNTDAAGSNAYPYALVFKNPKHWKKPPSSWSDDDLVPNDSRMYETKLVLWRLLSDPELFKNMRFGMATTYLSPSNVELGSMSGTHHGVVNARQDYNGIFKVAPFGGNVWTIALFDEAGKAYVNDRANIGKAIKEGAFQNGYRRVKFGNGILTSETTGNMETHCALFGQYYPMWMNAKVQSYYDTAKVQGNPSKRADEEDGWWSSMGSAGNGGDYMAGQGRDRPMFKLMNRASLWLPIEDHDHLWTKGGRTITQIDKFKMWINGVADIKSAGSVETSFSSGAVKWGDEINRPDSFRGNRASQFYYYNDPEIGIAGNFYLAQAIFPDPTKHHPKKPGVPLHLDRDFYHEQGYVWYSKKDKHISYKIDKRRYSQEQYWSGRPRAFFNAGSGEAAGSVMDFFSPRRGYAVKGSTSYGKTYANESYDQLNIADSSSDAATLKVPANNLSDGDLAEVSFPITNPCEDNWLVVVASGCEPNVKDGDYEYPAWQAVKNLYDATNAATSSDFRRETSKRKAIYEGVTMLDKNTRKLRTADLDNPIRTLVIGIVADPEKMLKEDPSLSKDDPAIKEIRRMRLNLIRMANAGQGLDADKIAAITLGNMYDAPHQPYFASDSAELLDSFNQALVAVNKSDAVQPGRGSLVEAPAEGDDLPSAFSTSYRIIQGDQWAGHMTRYLVSRDEDGFSTLAADWELGLNLLARRGDGENPLRARDLKYWSKTDGKFMRLGEDDTGFAGLLGINGRVSPANLPGASFGPTAPGKALYWWLQGYDYSYASGGRKYPRSSMLADFGNSGIVYADFPKADAMVGLPGYQAWANSAAIAAAKGTERLYAQTNDGVLHVIVPSTGQEESAILPPPSLLPSRLAALKTYSDGTSLFWQDVKGGENISGIRSNPCYTLDGPLQKRRFDLSAAGDGSLWRTLLLGTLGRGGNGLYALDITAPNAPAFLWYRENIGFAMASMGPSDDRPLVAPPSAADPYSKLGFNSPKPAMGMAGAAVGARTNFIALPGGSQSSYAPALNGNEGAVLLFIDPKDGSVVRAFDSKAVAEGAAPKAGAGVTGIAPYMGMMVSEPTLLKSLMPSNAYMTGRVFASDDRGSVFMVSLESLGAGGLVTALPPSEWSIRTVATLQKDIASAVGDDSGRVTHCSVPHGFCAERARGKVWLGGGTANVAVKKSGNAPDGELKNDFQMIFAFRVPDAGSAILARDDLKALDDTGSVKLLPDDLQQGWYIMLRPGEQNAGEEYVTAKPVLAGGVMYIPTFRQTQRINTGKVAEQCAVTREVSGESRLYAVDMTTGGAGRWTDTATHKPAPFITITDAKITELRLRETEDSYFVTTVIDKFSDSSNFASVVGGQAGASLSSVNSAEFRARKNTGGGAPPEKTIMLYWLKT